MNDICISLWNGNIALEQYDNVITLSADDVEDFIEVLRTLAETRLDFYAQPE